MGDDAINVEVCSIRELLHCPLQVPSYQRPYVWQASNVLQLIEDIADSAPVDPTSNASKYRIGTVIIYRNEDGNSLDIVDGQQRVITLHLILTALEACDGDMRLDMHDDEQTRRHLYENYRAIRQLLDSWEGERRSQFVDRLFDGCEVLRIEVARGHLSEAFQMFDSQNARGKELDPTDLLKAFHLRCMDAVDNSTRKQQLVRRWELHQDEIQPLFGTYLYRIACWSRREKAKPGGLDSDSIGMFKGIDLPGCGNERRCVQWQRNFVTAWYANTVHTDDEPETSYTFQIDQPVINGEAFFCYAEHYRRWLQQQIMHDEDPWRDAYADIAPFANTWRYRYMTELFHTILLYYRDRFGDDDAADVARMAFLYAAYMRLGTKSLSFAAVNNYVLADARWEWRNARIFEVIRNSDRGSDVLSQMARIPRKPIEDSDDLGLWYRYMLRSSRTRVDDGKASSSEGILHVLIDNLQQTRLFAKADADRQPSSLSGWDVFDVLYKAGFIVHRGKGSPYYCLQEKMWSGRRPEDWKDWKRRKEWAADIDGILKAGKGR